MAVVICVAPTAFAQVYERKQLDAPTEQVLPRPVQKQPSCDDVVVTQQLQTLMLLTQQLQVTRDLGVIQVDILRAIQRLDAQQHSQGAGK